MKWADLATGGYQIPIQIFTSPGQLASRSTPGTASVSYTETQTVTSSSTLYHQHLFVQYILPDFNQRYLLTNLHMKSEHRTDVTSSLTYLQHLLVLPSFNQD